MEGKTVIAIAHRLSTIAAMDRLIVLEAGDIAEPERTRSCSRAAASTRRSGVASPAGFGRARGVRAGSLITSSPFTGGRSRARRRDG